MRHWLVYFALVCFASNMAAAQEAPASDISSAIASTQYMIEVTQYQPRSSISPEATASEIIVALLKPEDPAKKADVIESVRLTAMSGVQSMAQFSRINSFTFGTTAQPGRNVRQSQSMNTGTVLRALASPSTGGKVAVKITFESSRIPGEPKEDALPETISTQIELTQTVELGKTMFLGGSTSDGGHYLLMTVTQL